MGELIHTWFGEAPAAAALLMLALAFSAVMGVWLSVIDFRTHLLPDELVLPWWSVTLVLLGGAGVLGQQPERAWMAVASGLGYALIFLGLWVATRKTLGFGDVKLAGVLGTLLGFFDPLSLVAALLFTFVVAGLYAAVLLVLRRAQASTHIAFGPFMISGTALALLLH